MDAMHTHSVVRRISVLTLAVILSFVGMPRPTSAAGEEDVVVTRHRGLTFNGRPLSELAVLRAPQARPSVPPPNRRRVSADRLLGGAPVADSFAALQGILTPGVEVIVRNEAGNKTRGWVSSISDDQVAVFFEERAAFSRRPADRIFAADSIARIDAPDSSWNGALIGAVVGVGLGLAIYSARTENCNVPGVCPGALLGGVAALVSVGVGGGIDHRIVNSPIYERPVRTPQVMLAPMLGRDAIGVSARVGF